jgi:hypothetical protein
MLAESPIQNQVCARLCSCRRTRRRSLSLKTHQGPVCAGSSQILTWINAWASSIFPQGMLAHLVYRLLVFWSPKTSRGQVGPAISHPKSHGHGVGIPCHHARFEDETCHQCTIKIWQTNHLLLIVCCFCAKHNMVYHFTYAGAWEATVRVVTDQCCTSMDGRSHMCDSAFAVCIAPCQYSHGKRNLIVGLNTAAACDTQPARRLPELYLSKRLDGQISSSCNNCTWT